MKLVALFFAAGLLLASCETPPQVTPQPNIAGIRASNAQTQKHISSVRQHLTNIRRHESATDDHLRNVDSDLGALLRGPVTADPTPIPLPSATPTGTPGYKP